ncbi:hypothetical protein Moror_12282 [Moniliophthora roreri MCA 2997]|uniref:Uncharacterized protein n=1 Tax=Moniliophthora roreri (strain MCA 2997) TaxID=1381753 RepID=V2WRE8_MONRO|nr:hypothetical protein Moror_12282 [Moniliophthora roreri MCA 2997]KAI3606317.1 hypothetical protein WG66_009619 [Moniliophthora roreri]
MSPNHAAELVTAIAEDGHGVAVVIGAIVTFVLAFALYRLLRLIYPCLTLFELESAESSLDVVFDNAVKSSSLYGYQQELIRRARLRLKRKASEIRSRSLQNSSSIWRTYLGFHPELLSEIIEWSNDAEKLRRDILLRSLEMLYLYCAHNI